MTTTVSSVNKEATMDISGDMKRKGKLMKERGEAKAEKAKADLREKKAEHDANNS